MKTTINASDSGEIEVTFKHFTHHSKKIKNGTLQDYLINCKKISKELNEAIKVKNLEIHADTLHDAKEYGDFIVFRDEPFTVCKITYKNSKGKTKVAVGVASLIKDRVVTDIVEEKKSYKRSFIQMSKANGRKRALNKALKQLRPQAGNDVCNQIRSFYHQKIDSSKTILDIIVKNINKHLKPFIGDDEAKKLISNFTEKTPDISPGLLARAKQKTEEPLIFSDVTFEVVKDEKIYLRPEKKSYVDKIISDVKVIPGKSRIIEEELKKAKFDSQTEEKQELLKHLK